MQDSEKNRDVSKIPIRLWRIPFHDYQSGGGSHFYRYFDDIMIFLGILHLSENLLLRLSHSEGVRQITRIWLKVFNFSIWRYPFSSFQADEKSHNCLWLCLYIIYHSKKKNLMSKNMWRHRQNKSERNNVKNFVKILMQDEKHYKLLYGFFTSHWRDWIRFQVIYWIFNF